jgi:hypothetical protein
VFAANLVEKNHPILHQFLGIGQHCVLEMHPHLAGLSTVLVHMLEKLGCGACSKIAVWRLESCAYLDVGVKQSGEGKERSVVRFAQPRGGRGCESLLRKIL